MRYDLPVIDYGPPPIPKKVRYDQLPYVPAGPGLVSDIEFLFFQGEGEFKKYRLEPY